MKTHPIFRKFSPPVLFFVLIQCVLASSGAEPVMENPLRKKRGDLLSPLTGNSAHLGKNSAGATRADAPRLEIPFRTAGFNHVIPGESKINETIMILGQPIHVEKIGGDSIIDAYVFQVEGFRGVIVHVNNRSKIVEAISVDLEKPENPRELAEKLGLDTIQSVFMSDHKGNVLGEIFREIGVSFGYDPDEEPVKVMDIIEKDMDTSLLKLHVVQILFQPISPDCIFLYRHEDTENKKE